MPTPPGGHEFPWLPPHLQRADNGGKAVLGGWLMAFAGSVLIGYLLSWVAPDGQKPEFGETGLLALFLLVVFAPAVETLIMGGVIEVLRRLMRPRWAALVSALGWGAAHSWAAAIWGLVIWWPFLIFSSLYLVWRERGWGAAMLVAGLTHALHNLIPALMIAVR